MKDISLSLRSLAARKLASLLAVLLTAFGVMMALVVMQFTAAVQERLARDGSGIDIVVGAKGSPLQLVLSALYHADVPSGNIPYAEAQKWMQHPQVRAAYPLALGDNWRGFRIVGTTVDYARHYGAEVAEGRFWQKPFEAVAGADSGLTPGARFTGAHGLTEGGHHHDAHAYTVVGTLKPTGSVVDRLILTSLDSVLELHGQSLHAHHDDDDDGDGEGDEEHEHHDDAHAHGHVHSAADITAILIKTSGPIANINLPRSINQSSALIAANPALEMARLSAVFGVGTRTLGLISAFLIALAALGIFAGIAGSLENRQADLAVLRALGYTPLRLFRIVLYEGVFLAACGLALGLALGIGGYGLAVGHLPALAHGAAAGFQVSWAWLSAAVLFAGLLASALPALRAARTAPADMLSLR
ncbi:MAG TPA: FtsX-like permease family protein [Alphaproteobacteria bacterium]|nr:multidrug ABC transporter substrate-binding protein [Rhodospirillaceae bacterium]HRJ65683.1 FtsX-like permease family protein [Alphaproteobacteria bacterium]